MNDAEIIDLTAPEGPGFRYLELKLGDVHYRAISFDDGTLRIFDVRSIRPAGTSIIIEPYASAFARKASREQTPISDNLTGDADVCVCHRTRKEHRPGPPVNHSFQLAAQAR